MGYITRFEKIDEVKIEDYLELNNTEYNDLAICNREHLCWKYFQNPDGQSRAYHLYFQEQLVGRIVFQYRSFISGEVMVKAASIIDLLIHPDHRQLKNFLILMQDLKKVKGIDFFYFIPNEKSMLLYKKVLKYSISGNMNAVVFPLNFRKLFKNRLGISFFPVSSVMSFFFKLTMGKNAGGIEVQRKIPEEKDFSGFINRSGITKQKTSADRSFNFFKWRFCQGPVDKYYCKFFYKNNQLTGYLVTRIQNYLGYNTLILMDFLFDYNLLDSKDLKTIRSDFLKEAHQNSCDLVFSILNLKNEHQKKFVKFPLMQVPKKMLPQELPLFLENLSSSGNEIEPDFFINLADFDLF